MTLDEATGAVVALAANNEVVLGEMLNEDGAALAANGGVSSSSASWMQRRSFLTYSRSSELSFSSFKNVLNMSSVARATDAKR